MRRCVCWQRREDLEAQIKQAEKEMQELLIQMERAKIQVKTAESSEAILFRTIEAEVLNTEKVCSWI